ncbi:DUF2158 domain-containing protein [Pseudomonas sp. CFBP 8772]|uniref:DUF2158 domain-containing protein n=1 Tax=Pseudomonas sp. CFBP 8772 TaxID=2775284 RepID=UPI001784241F|nr:DUF2158 domain-containing protein [Pseudomonas sp. CFBP 8772]MBD8598758.1 DUF2158 domain-containing protein [Pseudomonas sp. CFBP 8772]
MSTKFSVGDVVRSRIGDHDMTITNSGPIEVGSFVGVGTVHRGTLRDDLVVCEWFAAKKHEQKRVSVSDLSLVLPAQHHEFFEGQIVQLASGGPKMLIEACGPMHVGGGFVGSATQGVKRVGGSVRDDLAACKWEVGAKTMKKRFQLSVLKPV